MDLQPSELAKPSFVVIAAWFLAEHTKRPDMPGHVIAYMIFAIFVGLLVVQPDFGQTALVVLTFGGHAAHLWHSVDFGSGPCGARALSGVLAAYALVPHVTSRIDRFLNPDKGDTFQVDTATQLSTMAGCWAQVPVAARPSKFFPMRIRISPLQWSARSSA